MAQFRLSEGAEALVPRLQGAAPGAFHCDVLIVGSGYGGAVAAARLGGAMVADGHDGSGARRADVWLLERGREHVPGDFPSRFSELPGHVRFSLQDGEASRGRDEGLFDVRLGGEVSALLGNGLGGGSLINAAVMVEPDAQLFQDARWPQALRQPHAMSQAFQAATTMLQPAATPTGREPPKLRAFDALAGTPVQRCPVAINQTAAPVINLAQVALQPCTACGDCITGCNEGAKGSLDTNYLAEARRREVEIFCGATVSRLEALPGGGYAVHWSLTDRSLPALPPDGGTIRARRVILAAGAFGSTEILLRSQARGGLVLSSALGQGFSTNGSWLAAGAAHAQPVHATDDEETDPGRCGARQVGPTINGLASVTAKSAFVVEEFAVPASLGRVFGELVATLDCVLQGSLLPDGAAGTDPLALTPDVIDKMSLYGFTGDDGAGAPAAGGGVTGHRLSLPVPGADAGLKVEAYRGNAPSLQRDQRTWFRTQVEQLGARPLILPVSLTVHPLGGCRMGDKPADGVVDDCGRVHGHDGLAVLDGSILPAPVGRNPALTIAALAERAVVSLGWGLQLQAGPGTAPLPRRIAPVARRALPAASATWVIHEHLSGTLMLGGQAVRCSAELEFEPIAGFRKLLARPARLLKTRPCGASWFTATVKGADGRDEAIRCPISAEMALFAPGTAADPRRLLQYTLELPPVPQIGMSAPWQLVGTKRIGQDPDHRVARDDRSPWRQLTDMEMTLGGQPVGQWSLDMGDHAGRRNPLLQLTSLSSMPDALDDLGALVAYGLRALAKPLNQLFESGPEPSPARLPGRTPGPLQGMTQTRYPHPLGSSRTLLTRYQPAQVSSPPVLLLHGLGTSGSSFTLLDEPPHAGPPRSLAGFLGTDREVWVLEVRSSVALEANRSLREAADWTVEGVAQRDLRPAMETLLKETGAKTFDVVAHCMGAVMFCLAALGGHLPTSRIGRVVLSQVGPVVMLSPLNRLRGYAASYLLQFLGVKELDPCPPPATGALAAAMRGLAASFPYDTPGEYGRTVNRALAIGAEGMDLTRARGDWIFGQLFELEQLDDDTFARLDQLLGWVKMPMLAQAIHFARYHLLMDTTGRNRVVTAEAIEQHLRFPVLIVHGEKNKVFEPEGSAHSYHLLTMLRTGQDAKPDLAQLTTVHHGDGTPTQLRVFKGYGHLDTLIGKSAHQDVFPTIRAFLDPATALRSSSSPSKETLPGWTSLPSFPKPKDKREALEFDPAWLGPTMGWLRKAQGSRVAVSVTLKSVPMRMAPEYVLVVPWQRNAQGAESLVFSLGRCRRLSADERKPERGMHLSLDLDIDLTAVNADTFAVFTAHRDLPIRAAGLPRFGDQFMKWIRKFAAEPKWLAGWEPLMAEWTQPLSEIPPDQIRSFRLSKAVVAAADTGRVATDAASLHFAFASCQYPPGLLDQAAAGAALSAMAQQAAAPGGPQLALLLGDQVYLDDTAGAFEPAAAASDAGGIEQSYELTWRLKGMRRLGQTVPVLTMLDDHEVRDNWPGEKQASNSREAQALEAYARYQAPLNPKRPLVPGSRSHAVYPAGVPFFVLDTRSARDLRTAGRSPQGGAKPVASAELIPQAVMQALIVALRSAPVDVAKFIASPVPLLPPQRPGTADSALRDDGWGGFPASVQQLLTAIRKHDIRKVVLLAGDAHLSSVSSLRFTNEAGGPIEVVSVVSSGLYTPWPFANQAAEALAPAGPITLGGVAGTLVRHGESARWGHASVALLPKNGDRHGVLEVKLHPVEGPALVRHLDLS